MENADDQMLEEDVVGLDRRTAKQGTVIETQIKEPRPLDASWYVETTPYHADVAPTNKDPLTQPPRAKEVQFIVSEPQSWPQDEATVFAASSSPSSTHLGLMLPTDKRLCHGTAEKCIGTKPKESSLPQGPSKFKPSAAAAARGVAPPRVTHVTSTPRLTASFAMPEPTNPVPPKTTSRFAAADAAIVRAAG